MLRYPADRARNAMAAARRAEQRGANQSAGRGAIHISGQRGSRPLPRYARAAVTRQARKAARKRRLFADAMEVSPERAVAEGPEFGGSAAEAAADPEHDETLEQRAGFKSDFPGIFAAQE